MGKFLQRKPLAEAVELLTAPVGRLEAERVAVEEALGRVTAQVVHARHPAPHYRASAMDGIAVRSVDTAEASSAQPLLLQLSDEEQPPAGCCRVVDTGNLMPDWADAVVRIEDTEAAPNGFRIRARVGPGRDVRRAGEDVDEGARVLGRGHRLRPVDIGALLATGVAEIDVVRRPRVAILATGSELVEPGGKPQPGRVIEYNSRIVAGMVSEWGAVAETRPSVADDEAAMAAALREAAAGADAVCVIAGSSAGRADYTPGVLADIGKLVVHGVDVMPGKPVALAHVDGTAIVGLPGYPVSAVVACEQLLRPLIDRLHGLLSRARSTVDARVVRKIPSRLGVEEFRRVALRAGADGPVVAPLPRGAGAISTVVRAHAWLRIGPRREGYEAGETAAVEPIDGAADWRCGVVVANRPGDVDALDAALDRISVAGVHLGAAGLEVWAAVVAGEADLGEIDGATAAELEDAAGSMQEPPYRLPSGNRVLVVDRSFAALSRGKEVLRELAVELPPS